MRFIKLIILAIPLFPFVLDLSVAQDVLSSSSQPVKKNSLAIASASANVPGQCKTILEHFGNLAMVDSTKNDLLFDWDRFRPINATFALMLLEFPNNRGGALSVTALPQSDGTCSVLAEHISTSAQQCKDFARNELKTYNETRLLPSVLVYTSKTDAGSSISLINMPSGCLVIRRYANFYTTPQKLSGR